MKTITKEELKGMKKPYNLFGYHLTGSFQWVEFNKANLVSATLQGLDLQWADFREANLFHSNLSEANLHGANFHNVNLGHTSLSGANLTRADLRNANLSETSLHKVVFDYTKLNDANLYWASSLHATQLAKTNLLQFRYKRDLAVAHTSKAYGWISPKKTIVILGYESRTIEDWLKNYTKIFNLWYNYTKEEIEMYYRFFELVANSCER